MRADRLRELLKLWLTLHDEGSLIANAEREEPWQEENLIKPTRLALAVSDAPHSPNCDCMRGPEPCDCRSVASDAPAPTVLDDLAKEVFSLTWAQGMNNPQYHAGFRECKDVVLDLLEGIENLQEPAAPSVQAEAPDMGLVGESNIPWSSVEGAPQPASPDARELARQFLNTICWDQLCEDAQMISERAENLAAIFEAQRQAGEQAALERAARHQPVIYELLSGEQPYFCCTECDWKGTGEEWTEHVLVLLPDPKVKADDTVR